MDNKFELWVFVSGSYRDKRGIYFVKENIRAAEEVAIELINMGFVVICPHKNTAFIDGVVSDPDILDMGLALLEKCDIIVRLPGWKESEGSIGENNKAAFESILQLDWPLHKDKLKEIATRGSITAY